MNERIVEIVNSFLQFLCKKKERGGYCMKWWKLSGQILLLFCFAWTGEWIAKQAHLPVPGSIIGIFLLLISLKFNLVKKSGYKTVQTFY